jgi:hypothetical protein
MVRLINLLLTIIPFRKWKIGEVNLEIRGLFFYNKLVKKYNVLIKMKYKCSGVQPGKDLAGEPEYKTRAQTGRKGRKTAGCDSLPKK